MARPVYNESQHPRDRAGKFSARVGDTQEGSLDDPIGTVPDDRFDRPGPRIEKSYVDPEWDSAGYEWTLRHGAYGLITDDGKARWSVDCTEGFASDFSMGGSSDDSVVATMKEIDQHTSALSHITMHHTGSASKSIRLLVKKDGNELSVSSYDSRAPLGRVHADGTFSVEPKATRKSFIGLEYY